MSALHEYERVQHQAEVERFRRICEQLKRDVEPLPESHSEDGSFAIWALMLVVAIGIFVASCKGWI